MSRCFFASGSGATSAPGRYAMDFAQSADTTLQRISDAAGAEIQERIEQLQKGGS
jgi:hypothetical protein